MCWSSTSEQFSFIIRGPPPFILTRSCPDCDPCVAIVLNLNAPLTSNVMGHIVSLSGMCVITPGIAHMERMKIIAKITLILALVTREM